MELIRKTRAFTKREEDAVIIGLDIQGGFDNLNFPLMLEYISQIEWRDLTIPFLPADTPHEKKVSVFKRILSYIIKVYNNIDIQIDKDRIIKKTKGGQGGILFPFLYILYLRKCFEKATVELKGYDDSLCGRHYYRL